MSRVWRSGKVGVYSGNEYTNDVCGMSRVGRQRRNGNEWRNAEVGMAVA